MSVSVQQEDNKAENEEVVIPVYIEKTVITVQPHGLEGDRGERYPLPVSTASTWRSNFLPLTGLQFLAGVEHIKIQQTVELSDLLSNIESENRYVIKTDAGETLFIGNETSSSFQRFCFGSGRSFQICLFDPTKQKVLILERRLACSVGILGCYLQNLNIYTPQGNLLGSVVQEWTLVIPRFIIKDEKGSILYFMEGPNICPCSMFKEATFKVFHESSKIQVSSISHSWEDITVSYNLNLTFPSHQMENNQKALLIGAGFLLEYMFFETSKRKNCSCWN